MLGSTKNDHVGVAYSGTNNGVLDIQEYGQGGSDQLTASAFLTSGSTGSVGQSFSDPAVINATGKAHISFTIDDGTDSTSTTNVFAKVVATSRKAATVRTANVGAPKKGSDTIVPS